MCGIIGYENHNVTNADLEILQQVMLESRIRGKHASGIAWYDGKKIHSKTKPVAIDELLNGLDLRKTIYNTHEISIIAHARYSTSDIQYNQPLVGTKIAIAHNGVISQASSENWKDLFGYKCKTKNDSELLLRAIENNDEPTKKFPGASIAVTILDSQGHVRAYRNTYRPLWEGTIGQGKIFASTFDILHKSGVKNIKKLDPIDNITIELQRRNMTSWIPRISIKA